KGRNRAQPDGRSRSLMLGANVPPEAGGGHASVARKSVNHTRRPGDSRQSAKPHSHSGQSRKQTTGSLTQRAKQNRYDFWWVAEHRRNVFDRKRQRDQQQITDYAGHHDGHHHTPRSAVARINGFFRNAGRSVVAGE